MLIELNGHKPKIGSDVYMAPTATVVGDVQIGDNSSIWFQAVLRGDVEPIVIGHSCNIQDGTVVHGTYQKHSVTLEDRVSVGHNCVIHGCYIGSGTLVGMSCTIMDGARIGKNCLIGAGSLITQKMEIPDGHLAFGAPARAVRPLTPEELKMISERADNYILYKSWYPEPDPQIPDPKIGEEE